jgi:hypothetical protein
MTFILLTWVLVAAPNGSSSSTTVPLSSSTDVTKEYGTPPESCEGKCDYLRDFMKHTCQKAQEERQKKQAQQGQQTQPSGPSATKDPFSMCKDLGEGMQKSCKACCKQMGTYDAKCIEDSLSAHSKDGTLFPELSASVKKAQASDGGQPAQSNAKTP